MEKINLFLASKTVEISEHSNYIELLNRVCYYGEPNGNGARLPYDKTSEEKAKTLVNMPVVAKYTVDSSGKPTFKGHEVSLDSSGEIVYGTTPIGVHTEVYIQDDTVELIDKRTATLPCLFAKLKIWKRNKNAVAAIKRLYEEDNLHNSWEISVSEYQFKDGIRDLIDYVFDGNALIGVPPAYGDAAKVLSISTQQNELLIAEALSQDLLDEKHNTQESEVNEMEEEKIEQQDEQSAEETSDKNEPVVSDEVVVQCAEKSEENESEIVQDESISEEIEINIKQQLEDLKASISGKDEALISANSRIKELEEEVKALIPFKTAHEESERKRMEEENRQKIAELRKYVEDSGLFTNKEIEGEDLSALINELKIAEIKTMISDRFVNKMTVENKKNTEIATSKEYSQKERYDIDTGIESTPYDALKAFMHK